MKTVTIYTDGACSGNPGPGGWGAILQYGKAEKELSGSEPSTTNNRMELLGVITALETLKEPCLVDLYSDSKYVVDGITKGWAKGWRARGWVKSDKKPAKNPELWGRLLDLLDKHEVRFHWVKGSGEDALTVPLMSLGASGTISVWADVQPQLVHDMCRAYLDGDVARARDIQIAGQPLINALFSEVNPIPVKEALAQMGMIEANYRMPLCPMADDTRAALTDALKGAGLLD